VSAPVFFSAKLTLDIPEAINDINPSLSMGDEGINSVLNSLQRIRERALSSLFSIAPFFLLTYFYSVPDMYLCAACRAHKIA
jgi:hypothetical protein